MLEVQLECVNCLLTIMKYDKDISISKIWSDIEDKVSIL